MGISYKRIVTLRFRNGYNWEMLRIELLCATQCLNRSLVDQQNFQLNHLDIERPIMV